MDHSVDNARFTQWLADRSAEAEVLDASRPDRERVPAPGERWAACETARIHHLVGCPIGPPLAQRLADLLHVTMWEVVDAFQQR